MESEAESSSPSPTKSEERFNEVYARLVVARFAEVIDNPRFLDQLEAHFKRLPSSYLLYINMDKVEDVLLHQKLLASAEDPDNQPVFHIRFLKNVPSEADDLDGGQALSSPDLDQLERGDLTCSKLEDLKLNVEKNPSDINKGTPAVDSTRKQEASHKPIHEVIFSTRDKPKLLSQLSSLLSEVGLNIREALVFSTEDGYSLDVFVVDGWGSEGTEDLYDALEKEIAVRMGSSSGSSYSQSVPDEAIAAQSNDEDWEIDWRLLNIGEKIADGSSGDLYRGRYLAQDVAIKVLKPEQLNLSLKVEFQQEVAILGQLQHENVVLFLGACTKPPQFCIVTEYMPRGSLYNYMCENDTALELPKLLKFAIDICKGMEYLHQMKVIHRDLKAANLLLDACDVVKVADFGIARFQDRGGVMTAETGTYKWMAPEVLNHQQYDQKADVFSFAIVLWELMTAKVPYSTMTPLQAALGVRQGLRPELPENAHPKLLDLMQRCWDTLPTNRPSFTEIRIELEELQQVVQDAA